MPKINLGLTSKVKSNLVVWGRGATSFRAPMEVGLLGA